jgi:hypothetical protein
MIADCQLPIVDWQRSDPRERFFNRQSTIVNRRSLRPLAAS